MQLMSGDLCFRWRELVSILITSYIIEENMCFLTLTEKAISKRVIFSFLEDVKNTFIAYVQNEHKDEFFFYWLTDLIDGEQFLPQWLVLMRMLALVRVFFVLLVR